jgi:Phage derived protein Gp49-like (DUF891)
MIREPMIHCSTNTRHLSVTIHDHFPRICASASALRERGTMRPRDESIVRRKSGFALDNVAVICEIWHSETDRARAGYELFLVQCGLEPTDWKPMSTVGAGVREIRVRDSSGAFRVIYLVPRPEAIYVLHCFSEEDADDIPERY